MATVVDSLLVQIDASTELLRKELVRGTQSVDNFSRQTESRLGAFQNRFTQVSGKLRSTFALFGIGFGVNAFKSWIEDATKIDKLTATQAEALKGYKAAMVELNAATDDLAQTIAVKLAPVLENSAKFWREFLFPTGSEKAASQLDDINRQISETARKIFDLQSGKAGVATRGATRESMIAQLKAQVENLRKEREALMGAVPTPEEVTLGQKKWNDFVASLNVDTNFGKLPAGMAKFDFPGAIRDVQQSAIQPLDLNNLVTKRPEGMATFPWDKAAKDAKDFSDALAESTKRSKDFADTFAASFESRGIQALLDGDLSGAVRGLAKDFAELVFRLAVLKPLAQSLGDSITGTGIGKIFGFAGGGRPPMGRASIVGESGPELFVPDVPGRILSNAQSRMAMAGGGGLTIEQHFHNQYGNGPAYYADLAETGRLAAKTAYEAVFKTLGNKR